MSVSVVLVLNLGGWLTLRIADEMELRTNLVAYCWLEYGPVRG